MWMGEEDRSVSRKKLGKKLIKVFGGEKFLLYLAIGNDECGFWVWNYDVFFSFFNDDLDLRNRENRSFFCLWKLTTKGKKCTTMGFKLPLQVTRKPNISMATIVTTRSIDHFSIFYVISKVCYNQYYFSKKF